MNPFEYNAIEAVDKLVRLANIKITKKSLTEELQKHPHFPSLASLKDVLTEFKIKTVAARGSIEKLSVMPLPSLVFLTIDGGIFAPIRKVTDEIVEWYHTQRGWQKETLYEFEKKWSGAILLIEPADDSNEKGYKIKHIKELITKGINPIVVTGIMMTIGMISPDLEKMELISMNYAELEDTQCGFWPIYGPIIVAAVLGGIIADWDGFKAGLSGECSKK